MLNANHIREYVIRPTLTHMGMYSGVAEDLMLGTALVESDLRYLHQLGGPALGLWQMEPATHDDIWDNYLGFRNEMARKVNELLSPLDSEPQLMTNLAYACAMARIHYWRVPVPIPTSVVDQANYWKTYYNTPEGKGSAEEYIRRWDRVHQ